VPFVKHISVEEKRYNFEFKYSTNNEVGILKWGQLQNEIEFGKLDKSKFCVKISFKQESKKKENSISKFTFDLLHESLRFHCKEIGPEVIYYGCYCGLYMKDHMGNS
jgi:hypothetical protein